MLAPWYPADVLSSECFICGIYMYAIVTPIRIYHFFLSGEDNVLGFLFMYNCMHIHCVYNIWFTLTMDIICIDELQNAKHTSQTVSTKYFFVLSHVYVESKKEIRSEISP